MEKHASSAELKSKAKSQLFGKYGTIIPAILIAEAVMSLIVGMVSFPLDLQSTGGITLQFVIECALQLLASIFLAGQIYMYLNIACGGNIQISDVFYGFKNHPDKIILIQLIQLAFSLVCFIPCFISLGIYTMTDNPVMLILISVTLCIGLAAGVIITLMYSQSLYIMLDFPEFSAVQCLKFSRQIMKGNKARRFYLEVSFIPLLLLGVLSCCIGLLFLIPYMNTTYANFYLELMNSRTAPSAQHGFDA